MLNIEKDIRVIDLFSGIGGLTYGFQSAGLNVVAGIDNDETCEYGYTQSTKSKFILKNITDIQSSDMIALFGNADIQVLAGCAPCQPYSSLNQKGSTIEKAEPLLKFGKLIEETRPHIVSMENVAGLLHAQKHSIFSQFLNTLTDCGYYTDYKVINTADYGVPQNRKRLVLLASSLGPIRIPSPTHEKHITLRETIGDLPPIRDGEQDNADKLHRTRKLSNLNKKRIQATPLSGGSQKDWPAKLLLECHKKESGKSFGSVYGRMYWDKPGSTMTTQCIGLGNGRFGHPEQHRAISLREAARIQTFPDNYVFCDTSKPIKVGDIARFIGNAVPVRLGEVLGSAIKQHIYCRL